MAAPLAGQAMWRDVQQGAGLLSLTAAIRVAKAASSRANLGLAWTADKPGFLSLDECGAAPLTRHYQFHSSYTIAQPATPDEQVLIG
jgi:hypothetical protein